jgi:hypothetical protein
MQRELSALSDEAWGRLRRRVEGLTDDEYFWEPAPGCWTVRQRPDGTWTHDAALPAPDPSPMTTLAWRLWHIIDMYGEDRAPRWLGVPPQGPAIGLDDPDRGGPPSSAAAAIELLEKAHDRWDAHLAWPPTMFWPNPSAAWEGPTPTAPGPATSCTCSTSSSTTAPRSDCCATCGTGSILSPTTAWSTG